MMKKMMILFTVSLITFCITAAGAERWSVDRAREWRDTHGWLVGCNFSPSSAINQLEMWQKDSFDRATLDRELDWAESLGFNSLRVYLHSLAWQQDPKGFLDRMDEFLAMADKHRIGVIFVLFDSCWHPVPATGQQPAPKPHVHNSGWVQDPGAAILQDRAAFIRLKAYIQAVATRFRDDRRIHAWDVWNEPDNTNDSSYGSLEPKNKMDLIPPLLEQVFSWLREVNPSQPLTSGVWKGRWADEARLSATELVQLENSDVISFHAYGKPDDLIAKIRNLRRYGRPILCTEYMARPAGSNFDPKLGIMKKEGVAAYNWGFVSGKTQTIYPWDSWRKTYTAEPPVWFHDIFRMDGTPYRKEEVDYIRSITGYSLHR